MLENLAYEFTGNTSSFDRAIAMVNEGLDSVERNSDEASRSVDKVFNKKRGDGTAKSVGLLGKKMQAVGRTMTIGGVAGTAFFGGITGAALKSAAAYEKTEIAFSTMLGSMEQAKSTLSDLESLAKNTPLTFDEVNAGARNLLAFRESTGTLIDTMTMLGDVSAGVNNPLTDTIRVYNQIRGAGKLLGQDFRELAQRGILSLNDLAEHYGVTTEAASKMQQDGKVSFEDVRSILMKMTQEGGRFGSMMEKQAGTFSGQLARLQGELQIELRQLGKELLPAAKSLVAAASELIQVFNGLPGPVKKSLIQLVAVGAVLSPITAALGPVVGGVGSLITKFGGVGAAAGKAAGGMKAFGASLVSGGVAAQGLGVAIAGLVGYTIGNSLADFFGIGNKEEIAATLETYKKLTEQVSNNFSERAKETIERFQNISPGSRVSAGIGDALSMAERDAAGLKMQLSATAQEAESLAPTWKSLWMATGDQELTLQKMGALQKRLAEQTQLVAQLKKLRDESNSQSTNMRPTEEEIQRRNDMLEERKRIMEKQIDTYNNSVRAINAQYLELTQGAEASRRYQLSLEGLSEAQINNIIVGERWIRNEEQKRAEAERRKQQAASEQQALKSRADSIRQQMETPMESAKRQLMEYKKLYMTIGEDGQRLLSKTDFSRAVRKLYADTKEAIGAQKELRQEMRPREVKFGSRDVAYNTRRSALSKAEVKRERRFGNKDTRGIQAQYFSPSKAADEPVSPLLEKLITVSDRDPIVLEPVDVQGVGTR